MEIRAAAFLFAGSRYGSRPVLSNSTSLSTSPPAGTASPRPHPHRFRPVRLALLLLVSAVLSLFQPDCFRFAALHFIRFEAWRNDVDVQIGSVGGSLFEPVILRDSVWSYESENRAVTRFGIKTATASFSWRNLLPRGSGQWFQRLALDGVTGKVTLPLVSETTAGSGGFTLRVPRPRGRMLASPELFEAAGVDFIFASNGDYVRLLQTAFTLSNVEAGSVTAGQILVKQPWLTRTFRNVAGTTAIEDGKLQIAALTLEPGVEVQDFSCALNDLADGRLKFAVKLAAFGGDLRADVQILPNEPQFSIDVSVPFSRIDVAQLATFLGISDAAGGTIKTGHFSFRGPPQQFVKGSGELRFEAANFQWETRQWDLLVVGAKLLDGRFQIPELALTQGRNRVAFSGEMAWPVPGVAWWQSDFALTIKEGQLDDLTALSALLMPEFRFAAGRATIRGSVRGKDQKFDGQLVISGSQLRWRNAPLEKLDASIVLNGNEYQISNVSLRNGADYLSGSGVVNIVGEKQYWGELHASVQDLAKYAAILQQPIVPEPLAGGAFIDWDGEGSAKGHSGKFLARLHKVRSLGATAALLHPINADFEGSYSHGGMVFSNFALSDDESSFTAHVGVVDKAVSLQGMRLMHGQTLWLEGDALLPLDLWNAWPNTSLATLLDDHTVGKLAVTAYDLSLHETAQLTGLRFPIEGLVRGNVTAEGPLGALKTGGALTLSKARLPLGWSGGALTGVEGAASFDGQILRLEKFAGQHPTGDFSATGEMDFTNLRDPSLKLAMSSKSTGLRPFFEPGQKRKLDLRAALNLQITGPASAATVAGDALIIEASFGDGTALAPVPFSQPYFQPLFTALNELPFDPPPPFALTFAPWSDWRWNVRCQARELRFLGVERLQGDVFVNGNGAAPTLSGRVDLWAHSSTENCEATLEFREGFPRSPSISAKVSGTALAGTAFAAPFTIYITGPPQHPIRVVACAPPLTEKIIRAEFSGENAAGFLSGENRFSLLVPAELREGVENSDWPEIKAEPAPAPGGGAAQ